MKDVEIETDKLLAQLVQNRDAHRDLYEKAWKGYEKRVLEETEKLLKYLRKNGLKNRRKVLILSSLPIPEDHTDDYNVAISMLESEQRETLTLDQREYRQFFLDDWGWKQQFTTTNATYQVH